MKLSQPTALFLCLYSLCIGCAAATAAEAESPATRPYLLHLPGIGGHMRIDDLVTSGIQLGGFDAQVRIHDWTNHNPGLAALGGYDRNQREAQMIAEEIERIVRADPARRIVITAHSGGAGLAVWALEKLPEDVKIDTLVMIAPALSPQYDLSEALRHVDGKAYAFTSTHDPILGMGTRNFGTIDRVKTDAAGNVGFSVPDSADPEQYAKLVAVPYDKSWTRYGNAGDHIGAMMRPFAKNIIGPLLATGELPGSCATTRPATQTAR